MAGVCCCFPLRCTCGYECPNLKQILSGLKKVARSQGIILEMWTGMYCLSDLHANMTYSSWCLKTKSTATNSCSFYLTKSQENLVKFLTHFGPQVGHHFKATGNSLKILQHYTSNYKTKSKKDKWYLQKGEPAEAVLNKVALIKQRE